MSVRRHCASWVLLLLGLGVFPGASGKLAAADGGNPEAGAVALETAATIKLHGSAWNGRQVSVAIKDVSPAERSPRGWKDFYCFTPKGSIHVLVPEELAVQFFERFADKDDNPQPLAAYVEIAIDGSVYLRVRRR